MINVMINDNTIGIHKYITCSMFRQDSGWIVASFTNPLASSNHPQRATPIPPPIFVPKEVQEYIVPSIRDDIDMGMITKKYGGGGHPKAAGSKFDVYKVTKFLDGLLD